MNVSEAAAWIANDVDELAKLCFGSSVDSGWWSTANQPGHTDLLLQQYSKYVVSTKIALMHSELSEALEGYRKNQKDEHLPHHMSLTVELADTLIRIFDLAGAMGLPLGQAFIEKLAYNAIRVDHTKKDRDSTTGKKF